MFYKTTALTILIKFGSELGSPVTWVNPHVFKYGLLEFLICNDLIKMLLLPKLRTKNAIYGTISLTIKNIN